jgi:hypothetical protein
MRSDVVDGADPFGERATIRCIEAGLIPRGVLVLYPIDAVLRGRRILAGAAAILVTSVIVQAALGQAIPILSLLTVVLWLAAVRMTPALRAADDETRRPAVVVTATAIVARHGGAMRTWFFADLLCAHLSAQGGRMDLGLITNAGTRSFIDCAALESGGRLVEAVAVHLPIVTI